MQGSNVGGTSFIANLVGEILLLLYDIILSWGNQKFYPLTALLHACGQLM